MARCLNCANCRGRKKRKCLMRGGFSTEVPARWSARSRPTRTPKRGTTLANPETGKTDIYTGDYIISPTGHRDGRASSSHMRCNDGSRRCGQRKAGTTPRGLHNSMLTARVEERRRKATEKEAARREKERTRTAVLKRLRCRAAGQQTTKLAMAATLGEIADLLGAKSARLGDIAALLGVDEEGVQKVKRSAQKPLGRKAGSAADVSKQIGRNISAAVGPVLAALLNMLSFGDAPDPLGVLMLVLRNAKFRNRCFGEAGVISQLIGSVKGAENLTMLAVRTSWRQLVRERERHRACATLALAARSFKSRAGFKDFLSDVGSIAEGVRVLIGERGKRGRIWFRRHDEPRMDGR